MVLNDVDQPPRTGCDAVGSRRLNLPASSYLGALSARGKIARRGSRP